MAKIKIKKILRVFKRIPLAIARKGFLGSLLFILLAIVLGSFLFYKYCILIEQLEPELEKPPAQFNETLWQQVLAEKELQQARFEAADFKKYPDLFR